MKLSQQKRLNILSAAEQLFCQHGVENTSMDQVAGMASVSKRTVYNHFATKDELFHAIISNMQKHLGETAIVGFNPQQAIEPQLLAIARQEAGLLTSDKFLRIARVAFLHMLQQPELAKQLSANKIGCMVYLEDFLQQAMQEKVLVIGNLELAAKQFVYQIKSFVFYPHLYGFEVLSKQAEEEVIQELVRTFLARYKA